MLASFVLCAVLASDPLVVVAEALTAAGDIETAAAIAGEGGLCPYVVVVPWAGQPNGPCTWDRVDRSCANPADLRYVDYFTSWLDLMECPQFVPPCECAPDAPVGGSPVFCHWMFAGQNDCGAGFEQYAPCCLFNEDEPGCDGNVTIAWRPCEPHSSDCKDYIWPHQCGGQNFVCWCCCQTPP